ncbi:MAG: TRAM domain-containing protein [Clostridia bacterium]|nr:TRAM domain-containing protein [Clostridia bacterium]
MARKLVRVLLALLGAGAGIALVASVNELLPVIVIGIGDSPVYALAITIAYIVFAVVCGIIAFVYSAKIMDGVIVLVQRIQGRLSEIPAADVFIGIVGLTIGLLIAYLLSALVRSINVVWIEIPINAAIYSICGYLGWNIALSRRSEINVPHWFRRSRGHKGAAAVRPKILDTSVIIDGRILDICKTGIMEGDIVVPEFVLSELQHIADNADSTRRMRGRRGLDVLARMMEELDGRVAIEKRDYPEIEEVDLKLLKLALVMGGTVVTNDYNLNKVAVVQGVPVFNINELANAVRSVVVTGEELSVHIVKEGKEHNQGVAYLDDGTMIVVDGGKAFIGDSVHVTVTSVLQTSAGRMIFAKLRQSFDA